MSKYLAQTKQYTRPQEPEHRKARRKRKAGPNESPQPSRFHGRMQAVAEADLAPGVLADIRAGQERRRAAEAMQRSDYSPFDRFNR